MSQTIPHHRRGATAKQNQRESKIITDDYVSPLQLFVESNNNNNSSSTIVSIDSSGYNRNNEDVIISSSDTTTTVTNTTTNKKIGKIEPDIESANNEKRDDKIDEDEDGIKKKKKSSYHLGILSLIFFVSTIVNGLVVEGASEIVASSLHEEALVGSASTLFQCASCFFLPILLGMATSTSTSKSHKSSGRLLLSSMTLSQLRPYLQLTVAVMITSHCANLSVAYVSYPTKVVLKSAKLIPTMIVSTFFFRRDKRRRHYTTKDYMAATCLCIGAAGYSYDPSKKSSSTANATQAHYFGVILLTVSVIMDAFVPNLQQRLMSSNNPIIGSGTKITASDLMINVNGIATIGILIYMLLIEQTLTYVFYYCMANTKYSMYMLLNGISQAIGIYAYTNVIQASGSVVAVTISTLRKVVTITLSYIVFPGKPFLTVHFISASMVFIGICIQSFWNNKVENKKSRKKKIDT